jgi:hypothetical protein
VSDPFDSIFNRMFLGVPEKPEKPLLERFRDEREQLTLRLAVVERVIAIMEKNEDAKELLAILEKDRT